MSMQKIWGSALRTRLCRPVWPLLAGGLFILSCTERPGPTETPYIVVAQNHGTGSIVIEDIRDKGSQIEVRGHGAGLNRTMTINGIPSGSSNDRGEFSLKNNNFSAPADCQVTVSDGVFSTTATLSGCTSAPPPPDDPPAATISNFELIPDSVVGGFGSAGGWVTIASPPGDTMVILIASDNTAIAEVICPSRFANAGPGTCVNPANNTILDFIVDSHCIFEGCVGDGPPQTATISVTYAGVRHDAVLSVYPNPLVEPPAQLESISISPSTSVGGTDCCLKVFGDIWLTTVNYPDPTYVEVFSDHPEIAVIQDDKVFNTLPGTVIFTRPCCANPRPRVAHFNVTTSEVTTSTLVTVTTRYNGVDRTASFTVEPPGPRRTLAGLTVENSTPVGGVDDLVRATLTLAGVGQYTDEATYVSSNPAAASVPATQTISWGATSAAFFVTTYAVSEPTPVTITATMNGSTVTANLTVQAQAAQPPLIIDRAEYKGGDIRVEGHQGSPGRTIVINGVVTGQQVAGDGTFRVERKGFGQPPGCLITVTDGVTSATATLSGC